MDTHRIKVKELREALGWTQHQLAAYCGVDRSTVSKWESEPPAKGPALILLGHLQARVANPLPPHDADRVATAGPEVSGPALSREAAE
jgi:transcriptional regulator with XRE-family HTH domain